MVEAIVKNKRKILPCAALLEGEYGVSGVFVGVPCKLGSRGIEKILELKLTQQESEALLKSAGAVKDLVGALK
jgi:malate dehydrogenase